MSASAPSARVSSDPHVDHAAERVTVHAREREIVARREADDAADAGLGAGHEQIADRLIGARHRLEQRAGSRCRRRGSSGSPGSPGRRRACCAGRGSSPDRAPACRRRAPSRSAPARGASFRCGETSTHSPRRGLKRTCGCECRSLMRRPVPAPSEPRCTYRSPARGRWPIRSRRAPPPRSRRVRRRAPG